MHPLPAVSPPGILISKNLPDRRGDSRPRPELRSGIALQTLAEIVLWKRGAKRGLSRAHRLCRLGGEWPDQLSIAGTFDAMPDQRRGYEFD